MLTAKDDKLVCRMVPYPPPAAGPLPFGCTRCLLRGVLSMLDEECLLPHGTDSGFVALLQSQTQVCSSAGTSVTLEWFFGCSESKSQLSVPVVLYLV